MLIHMRTLQYRGYSPVIFRIVEVRYITRQTPYLFNFVCCKNLFPASRIRAAISHQRMDIPLDGSSLEAFETSLARVKAHTSAENYTTLVNAIEYHLVYDLSAERDRAKLAANLDGMTPREVIDKVIWRKFESTGSGASRNGPSTEPGIEL